MGVKLLCGQFAFNASAVLTGDNDGSVAVYNLRGFEQHPDDHVTITSLIAKSVGLNVLISFKQYIFSQVKSSQVYFFNSRIKHTAKLHNKKLYSEIYTVTHNKFIQ